MKKITLYSALLLSGLLGTDRLAAQVAPTKVFDLAPFGTTRGLSMALCGPTKESICYSTSTSFGEQGSTSAIYSTTGTSSPFKIYEGQKLTTIEATAGNVVYYRTGNGQSGTNAYNYGATNLVQATPVGSATPLLQLVPQFVPPATPFTSQLMNGGMVTAMDQGPTIGVELVAIPALGKPKTLVKDIDPGAPSCCNVFGAVNSAMLGGKMFFNARSTATGLELWTSDGTAAGTVQFSNFTDAAQPNFWAYTMLSTGSRIFLSANNRSNDTELWTCTAAPGSLTLVKDINPTADRGSSPKDFIQVGTNVFFSADDGTNGRELWVTDGTTVGTRMVKDLLPGAGLGSDPQGMVVYKGKLHFFAKNGAGTFDLYSTDGTAAGTLLGHATGIAGYIQGTYTTSRRLYYLINEAVSGKSTLWRTDGTLAGKEKVLPSKGATANNPYIAQSIVAKGSTLYFTADYFGTGSSLWSVQDPALRK